MTGKKGLALVVGVALAMTIFVGCAAPRDTAGLQAQLEQISGEISALKSEFDGMKQGTAAAPTPTPVPDAAPTPTPVPDAAASAPVAPAPAAGAAAKTIANYDIAGFTTRVNEMVKRAEAATTADYMTIRRDIEMLENDMEVCEDQAELDFRQGALSRQDYRQLEAELDQLDNQLGYAEDTMEYRLGYDD